MLPNFVAVNYYNLGDLFDAVDQAEQGGCVRAAESERPPSDSTSPASTATATASAAATPTATPQTGQSGSTAAGTRS